MLDIASGYTPRALMCHREGIDYIGCDLPAVVEKMGPFVEKLFEKGSHPTYVVCDATNAASLKQAADQLEGELFISCEGLLTYLNKSEMDQMIAAVRQVLLEHGGAWYTSDMGVKYDHFSAVAVNNPDVLQRFAKVMGAIRSETDVYFFPVAFETVEEKIAFFEERGLHVELVPFYTEDTDLNILKGFDADGQERMKNLMKSSNIWKLTAIEKKTDNHIQTANGLDIQYCYGEDTLDVALNGRLDTLSAPELMELFDKLSGEKAFSRLVMDLKNLEYLSSTGLRVFLMMSKRLGKENVVVDNANALVVEIFETTGFSEVVTIR